MKVIEYEIKRYQVRVKDFKQKMEGRKFELLNFLQSSRPKGVRNIQNY